MFITGGPGTKLCAGEGGSEGHVLRDTTVRHHGMETGISEASKRVSIFSFATQGGKPVSFHF